jgi:FolB domain-containing protein
MDAVFLRNLRFELAVGIDAWHRRGKPQLVFVSLEIGSGVAIKNAAAGDDVSKALDYGKLYKLIHGKLTTSNTQFRDVHALHDAVRNCIAPNVCVKVEITLPKALLRAEDGLTYARSEEYKDDYLIPIETLSINGISCACIIGVNPHERQDKQIVVVNLTFSEASESASSGATAQKVPVDRYQAITDSVVEVCYHLDMPPPVYYMLITHDFHSEWRVQHIRRSKH